MTDIKIYYIGGRYRQVSLYSYILVVHMLGQ